MTVPVITIDGPSASGKGTVAAQVAARLAFHYLDSGSLYRLLALHARRRGIAWDDEPALARAAAALPVEFSDGAVWLEGNDASQDIRAEEISIGASKVGALPAVRAALLQRQRDFCEAPGLVTDGRDMGSVVFPDATLKIFLTASAEERASRRHKQLIGKGESANLAQIMQDIIDRDARDAARPVAPLRQEPDAFLLDTTELTIDQAVDKVLGWFEEKQASGH
ncbi:(d)CMP kinase [Chromobacterium violaceum]|uniref:Cytidylate kinase n=1 Tax=Chromobacterium violaceum TaxID=536 RepID=A0AAX2M6B7_CHRVL|nr:(d)CMP kinase [Chromobacterium violaceum]OLZ82569.1 cytidylate kinase [Chromobacterium violaceum]STB64395.1 Cytidylate kinase [Chromobacterium violaceum]SUX31825.1 Cytidylate kinase [Chromobacterium violaceum]